MSSRMAMWFVVAPMGLAVVLVGAKVFNMQAQANLEREKQRDQLVRLAASVQELEGRPTSTRVVEHETRIESTYRPGDTAVHRTPPPPDGDETAGPAGKANRVPVEKVIGARLEARFTDEKADRQWSVATASALRDAVSGLGASQNVESLDCRSSLCRIESTFADLPSYNHFMDTLAGNPSGGDGMISPVLEQREDGSVHATSYWVRAGNMRDMTAGVETTTPDKNL